VIVRTILVVDDEWAIADWLHSLLTDEGYRVLIAANGKRALELLAEYKPDVLLTDVMMPVMDGPALLGALKSAGSVAFPIVVMSSLPEPAATQRIDGHAAFLRKPFRESELLHTLHRVLDQNGPDN
jgi:CheY-like chemotaxis protein